MSFDGHYWTIRSRLLAKEPADFPATRPWTAELQDARAGAVQVCGRLSQPAEASTLVILVHGLGGTIDSPYVREFHAGLHRAGLSVLALGLRGTSPDAVDFYNAGLTADLRTALESPVARDHARRVVVGFSLGGHVALALGIEGSPFLDGLVTVCSPLDLDASRREIDRPRAFVYRRHVLSGLRRQYLRIAANGGRVPTPPAQLEAVRTLYDYDRLTVVPRYGFRDPEDYYRRSSVGPRLEKLRVPTTLIFTSGDPMVPEHTVRPWLDRLPAGTIVDWHDRGGHLGFPPEVAKAVRRRMLEACIGRPLDTADA